MILASKQISGAAPTLVLRIVTGTYPRRIIICNTAANVSEVDLWRVPFDSVRGTEHQVLDRADIKEEQTVLIPDQEVKMRDREEIWAATDAAGAVSITVMD